jgi:hypothetical protein
MTTPLALAVAACRRHADHCPVCDLPAVERSNAGCHNGRRLALAWAGAWRAKVIGLSGRGRP